MRVKEWHRTVILLVLLLVAVGYLVWVANATDSSLVGTL